MHSWLSNGYQRHPRLIAWLALSMGMVAVFVWAARGQGLTLGQLVGMSACCIVLAGVCVWIIYWEAPRQGEPHDG